MIFQHTNKQLLLTTFWLIIIAEIFSFLGHLYPDLNTILFFGIIIATLGLAIWRLEIGMWIIASELFIGSFGYLFDLTIGGFRISIRLGLFIALLIAWIIQIIRTKKIPFLKSNLVIPFVCFLVVIGGGIAEGILKHHGLKNVFFDANAYLFFGLLLVAFSVINSKERILQLVHVLIAALAAVSIKTIVLLFYFSHQADENLFRLVYTWVRDTRVGEIAPIVGHYYRIFFQGHLWHLFAVISTFFLLTATRKSDWNIKQYRTIWLVNILASITVIISFSRSFWLALAMTLILIILYLVVKKIVSFSRLAKICLTALIIVILEIGFLTLLINIPIPGGTSAGVSAGSLIKERVTDTQEVAIGSRFQLLRPLVDKFVTSPIIGSGFGATVTYQTLDPRTMNANGGHYTTYAFEWGYLDIVVKVGLVGLMVYCWFIWIILKNGVMILKHLSDRNTQLGVLCALFSNIALLLAHLTTPYLNHPLGIFLLIITAASFTAIRQDNTAEHSS